MRPQGERKIVLLWWRVAQGTYLSSGALERNLCGLVSSRGILLSPDSSHRNHSLQVKSSYVRKPCWQMPLCHCISQVVLGKNHQTGNLKYLYISKCTGCHVLPRWQWARMRTMWMTYIGLCFCPVPSLFKTTTEYLGREAGEKGCYKYWMISLSCQNDHLRACIKIFYDT